MTVAEEKKHRREELLAVRRGLDKQYRAGADESIFRQVMNLEEYKRAKTIFCFVGTEYEIDTKPIIRAALCQGKRVGTPKCVARGVMQVYEIKGPGDLKPGKYGILEPVEGTALMEPEEIELALIPCVACSRDGWRLGYGGGYYDRYLKHMKGYKAVLCWDRLLCDRIPVEEYDEKADVVLAGEQPGSGMLPPASASRMPSMQCRGLD